MDKINPIHYKKKIETIDCIESQLSEAEFKGYLKGNIIKYISRSGLKFANPEKDDLMKAQWYLNRLLRGCEGEKGGLYRDTHIDIHKGTLNGSPDRFSEG